MKKLRNTLFILAGVMMFSLFGFAGGTTVLAATAEAGQISVSGSGSVNVNPDVAYVSLGVTTQNVSPKVAMDNNSTAMTSVIEALKALGIAERDIRTAGFYMNQNYDYDSGREEPTGYNVTNSLTVVVRKIDQAGEVIAVAADAGANVFGGVEFGLLDSAAAYNEALTLAIADAEVKAQTVAKALGKTVSAPVSVTEGGSGYTPVYAGAVNMAVADAAAGVPMQEGKLTISANVQVIYEYTL